MFIPESMSWRITFSSFVAGPRVHTIFVFLINCSLVPFLLNLYYLPLITFIIILKSQKKINETQRFGIAS